MRKGIKVHQDMRREYSQEFLYKDICGRGGQRGFRLYEMREDMEGMRQHYDRDLGDTKDFTRDMRNRTEDTESIYIRVRETSSNNKGTIFDLLEDQSKLETKEFETRKVRSNLKNAVKSLCIGRQQGCQGDPEGAVIDIHGSERTLDSLLG